MFSLPTSWALRKLHDGEAVAADYFLLITGAAAVNAPVAHDKGISAVITDNVIVARVEPLYSPRLQKTFSLIEHLIERHSEH
jgi:hypothetical protein